MKRIILLLIITLAGFSANLHAQIMEVGTNFLSLGIGPSAHYVSYHTGGTPAIRLAYDHGFRKIGHGTLTIGGSIGFFSSHYDSKAWDYTNNVYYNYTWRWTYIVGAFRLGYYYNFGEYDIPDLNVYGGLGIGLRYCSFSDNYKGPSQYYIPYSGSNTGFHFALYGGANYFLTKKLAFFLEFGYDISPVTAGITFNL